MNKSEEWLIRIENIKKKYTLLDLNQIYFEFNKEEINDKKIILNLILFTVNHVFFNDYFKISEETQNEIIKILQSLLGISNILSLISIYRNNKNEEKIKLNIILRIFYSLFKSNILLIVLTKTNEKSEIDEINKLFFKAKIYSLINEFFTQEDLSSYPIFNSFPNYVAFLNKSILILENHEVDDETIFLFIETLIKLDENSLNEFFTLRFNAENWDLFKKRFLKIKYSQQKNMILKFFKLFINQKVLTKKNYSKKKIIALFNVLKFTACYFDSKTIETLIFCNNQSLNSLIALILTNQNQDNYDEIILTQLKLWGNERNIKLEKITYQESRTQFLICLLYYHKSLLFLNDLLQNKFFLDSISNRLNSFSKNSQNLGILLADKICILTKNKLIFGDDILSIYNNFFNEIFFFENNNTDLSQDESWDILKTKENNLETTSIIPLKNDNDLKLYDERKNKFLKKFISNNSSIDDNDLNYCENDSSIIIKNDIQNPVFIKDILYCLNSTSKNQNDYTMKKLALTQGPTLIRQKTSLGNEVSFFSEDLLKGFLFLNNKYNIEDFEDLRLNCIISIIVTNPYVTFYIIDLLLTSDFSIKQRICVLSALAISSRELRGFIDDFVSNSYEKREFPSDVPKIFEKKINLSKSESSSMSEIYSSILNKILYEKNICKNDSLEEKVIHKSQKLNKNKINNLIKPKIDNFSEIITNNFFYPTINVWYNANGFNIGPFTTIFVSHYIKTLTILIHSAYPIAVSIEDMINEYLILVIKIISEAELNDLPLIENSMIGFHLILDISEESYLIENHFEKLVFLQIWIKNSIDLLIDQKIQNLLKSLNNKIVFLINGSQKKKFSIFNI